ncbi:hypothetical protein PI27_gp211 [Listeria phage WIL-1]|nr:hypothetical protein PI27_gp211 [Listeria phage WIL-1]
MRELARSRTPPLGQVISLTKK